MGKWKVIKYKGGEVNVPTSREVREREFADCSAYVEGGKIYCRSERWWKKSTFIRKHEQVHLVQRRVLGAKRFSRAYDVCDAAVGWWLNPFEISANVVAGVQTIFSRMK